MKQLYCIVLSSCQEDIYNKIDVVGLNQTIQSKNQNLTIVAKTLALSLHQSPKLREIIKTQALKKFDFQHDVLYVRIADEMLETKSTKELFEENLKKIDPNLNWDDIVNKLHYLQFSVPVHCESWNTLRSIAVVPLPVDRDEKKTQILIGYRGNLDTIVLSGRLSPSEPVVCVSEAERIDENGNLMVTQDGILLPPPNRLPLKDALAVTYPNSYHTIKKASEVMFDVPKLIEILPDDSFSILKEKLFKKKIESKENELYDNKQLLTYLEKNFKKTKSADFKIFELTGMSEFPLTVNLEWKSPDNKFDNSYKIYYTGYFKGEPVKILGVVIGYKKKIETRVTPLIKSQFTTISLPYANTPYIFKAECYKDNNLIGISNNLTVMPSYRSSGGREYISKIFISSKKAQEVEGWYDEQIEIAYRYIFTEADGNEGVVIEKEQGKNHYLNGSWKFLFTTAFSWVWVPDDTERKPNLTLFQWKRQTKLITKGNETQRYNNGIYEVFVRELDSESLGKYIGDASVEITKSLIALYKIYNIHGSYPDLVEQIITLGSHAIKYMSNDEPLINYTVNWWTPNNEPFEKDGFIVYHSYETE